MFPLRNYLAGARKRRGKLCYSSSTFGLDTEPTAESQRRFSPRFLVSITITAVLLISQLILFHYFIGYNNATSFSIGKPLNGISRLARGVSQGRAIDWSCLYPGLSNIYELAWRFNVDLVVVDPDLLRALDREIGGADGVLDYQDYLTFSEPFKSYQQSGRKSIVHLAIINETSGGQPNLKLFYNALKSNGYTTLKYDETGQFMQPEVYRRASHLFDDMPFEGVVGHKYSHDFNDDSHVGKSILSETTIYDYESSEPNDAHERDEVSKIYTEFISHLFILNDTQLIADRDAERKAQCAQQRKFIVIHIVVLYNYDYSPSSHWIQPGIWMDEMDKHKLLSYNVHSFDFRLPIDHYFIHPKRAIVSLKRPIGEEYRKKKSALDNLRVFEPRNDRILSFINNSYIHCKVEQFDIHTLRDNNRPISNYLRALNQLRPMEMGKTRDNLQGQLIIAMQFLDTFSRAYGNFSFWLTGSSLLAYHKYCELVLVSQEESWPARRYIKSDELIINLEIGLFASELNETVLEDLASAQTIGVVMTSNWRRSNSPIAFKFKDSPNLIFSLYIYELRRDFHEHYFVTRNSMIMSHRLSKSSNRSANFSSGANIGHHVFRTDNLALCWTRLDNFSPFKVPCNVHDHLRRIYVI